MQLTDIRIDSIVDAGGLPNHARGVATFADGRQYNFTVMFSHTYKDSRIFVGNRHREPPQHPGSPVARAIHERLGFVPIAQRERQALAASEKERVAACRDLIPSDKP